LVCPPREIILQTPIGALTSHKKHSGFYRKSFGALSTTILGFSPKRNRFIDIKWRTTFTKKRSGVYKMSFGTLSPTIFGFSPKRNHFIDSNWCTGFAKKKHSGVYKKSFWILSRTIFGFPIEEKSSYRLQLAHRLHKKSAQESIK